MLGPVQKITPNFSGWSVAEGLLWFWLSLGVFVEKKKKL